ncbi:MAG: hypothetical protein U0521_15815 [Anaerolineae bacterium]
MNALSRAASIPAKVANTGSVNSSLPYSAVEPEQPVVVSAAADAVFRPLRQTEQPDLAVTSRPRRLQENCFGLDRLHEQLKSSLWRSTITEARLDSSDQRHPLQNR